MRQPSDQRQSLAIGITSNTNNTSGKIQRYKPYIRQKDSIEGVNTGEYKRGELRVSASRTDEAYIGNRRGGARGESTTYSSDSLPDFLVANRRDRNRAVHGDHVIFKVFPRSKWVKMQDPYQYQEKDRKQGSAACAGGGAANATSTSDDYDSDASDEERESLDLFDRQSYVINGQMYHPTCEVVYIEELRGSDRSYMCVLRANRPVRTAASQDDSAAPTAEASTGDDFTVYPSDKMVKVVPIDKRIPWMLIPMSQAKKWVEFPSEKCPTSTVYSARIEKWDEFSALPLGKIVEKVGDAGDIDVEEAICMRENELSGHLAPFSDDCLEEASSLVEWAESSSEEQRYIRKDFTQFRVMTIDPPSARDLDDAIHVVTDNSFSPPKYEVGVHIADVTHFVQPGGPIDEFAASRCNTVYLTHKCYPMLPRELCDDLCSLLPDQERLTASVVFRLNADGSLDDTFPTQFSKSVIRTCARFSYVEAQHVLDHHKAVTGGTSPVGIAASWAYSSSALPTVQVYGGHSWGDIVSDLVILEDLTIKIRRARFDNGSLSLNRAKLLFTLDPVTCEPQSFRTEEHSSSHELIEELMLLCNQLVAVKVSNGPYAEVAVLRQHSPPDTKQMEDLQQYLDKLEIPYDFSSAGSTRTTIRRIARTNGPLAAEAVEQLVLKGFKRAEYYVYGDYLKGEVSRRHYALEFDFYSHFTSPIRRYPDMLLHRCLWQTLDAERASGDTAGLMSPTSPDMTSALDLVTSTSMKQLYEMMKKICERCNEVKIRGKRAQAMCDLSFLCIYLKKPGTPNGFLGTVLKIKDKTITVFVPELGKEKNIELKTSSDGDKCPKNVTEQFRQSGLIEWPTSYDVKSESRIIAIWDRKENHTVVRHSHTIKIFCRLPVYVATLDIVPLDVALFMIPPWHPECSKRLLTDASRGVMSNGSLPIDALDLGGLDLDGPSADASGPAFGSDATEGTAAPTSGGGRLLRLDASAAARMIRHHTENE